MLSINIKLKEMKKSYVDQHLEPFDQKDFLRLVEKYLRELFNLKLSQQEIKEIIETSPKDPYQ